MPRPTKTTSLSIIITVLRAIRPWFDNHAAALQTLHGDDFDAAARALELAEELDALVEEHLLEKGLDRKLSRRGTSLVEQTRTLVNAGISMATIVFGGEPDGDDIIADFRSRPPSRIRSARAAEEALETTAAALDVHAETMRATLANFDAFCRQVAEARAELERVESQKSTGAMQTKSVLRERNAKRDEALDFICEMQLTAESVDYLQTPALDDLQAMFDAHNPARRATTAGEGTDGA